MVHNGNVVLGITMDHATQTEFDRDYSELKVRMGVMETKVSTLDKTLETNMDKIEDRFTRHEEKVEDRFSRQERILYIGLGIMITVHFLGDSGLLRHLLGN